MKSSRSQLIEAIVTVFKKDFVVSLRKPVTFAAMLMFALTSTASLSLAVNAVISEPNLLAALLWVVIFFAASVGVAGTFDDEAAAGTLSTLRLYAEPQAVFFGKVIFVVATLMSLAIFIAPIFLIMFDCAVTKVGFFVLVVIAGTIGFAVAGTLIAALTVSASVKGGLFPILLFPIILPIFLPAIQLTGAAFTNSETDGELLILMIIYDAILLTASSILYDYIDKG